MHTLTKHSIMKHAITLIAAFALLCGSATAQTKKNVKVYICTGSFAKAYHIYRNCEGLNNCGAVIKQVKLEDAVKRGRHLCGYCKGAMRQEKRDTVPGETKD